MLARVSQRTGRQWLHSNLWGGSVTVLFLAPLPCVLRKLSVARPDDWTAAVSPSSSPPSCFSSLVPTDVTVASCSAGGWICFHAAWLTHTYTVTRTLTNPHPPSVSASLQYSMCLLLSNYRLRPSQAGQGQIKADGLWSALLHHSFKSKVPLITKRAWSFSFWQVPACTQAQSMT